MGVIFASSLAIFSVITPSGTHYVFQRILFILAIIALAGVGIFFLTKPKQ